MATALDAAARGKSQIGLGRRRAREFHCKKGDFDMATVRMVKAFKRIVRHNLKTAQRHLASLSAYNNAHVGLVPPLFTSGEQSAVESVIVMLQQKLDLTKPK
jgi:hypothetical protein